MLYVVAGHCCAAVSVSAGCRSQGRATFAGSTHYSSYHHFKEAVRVSVWNSQRRVGEVFSELHRVNPSRAQRFLSKSLRAHQGFEIALTEAQSGAPLSPAEVIQELLADLQARANNSFPQDEGARCAFQRQISTIRGSAGRPDVLGHAARHENCSPYTLDEVDAFCDALSVGKNCLGLPYAALKAAVPQSRRLTWALVSLSWHCALSSTHWALRQFNHIRKSGPRLVKVVSNLRPISMASDMAQVQDGLWVLLELRATVGGVSLVVCTIPSQRYLFDNPCVCCCLRFSFAVVCCSAFVRVLCLVFLAGCWLWFLFSSCSVPAHASCCLRVACRSPHAPPPMACAFLFRVLSRCLSCGVSCCP